MDTLSALGELAKTPKANIIKLPNVSASVPQLNEAIAELQGKGYMVPLFPQDPKTAEEKRIKERYAKVLGSAVNPVLREGNSDRRVAGPVKAYAQRNPHKLGKWSTDCKSHVASMKDGDFFSSEKTHVMAEAGEVRIEFLANAAYPAEAEPTVLKASIKVQPGRSSTRRGCRRRSCAITSRGSWQRRRRRG